MSLHSIRSLHRNRGIRLAGVALATGLFLGGCATSGEVTDRLDSIDQRLANLERQIDETDARDDSAENTAANALRRAEAAETNVRAAAARADLAAEKAAAAFDKTVNK